MRNFAIILSTIFLFGGFIWLFYLDWKIGLASALIFWGNEIATRIRLDDEEI